LVLRVLFVVFRVPTRRSPQTVGEGQPHEVAPETVLAR
jgi:hypothetical protein